jgi:hypothetical protein
MARIMGRKARVKPAPLSFEPATSVGEAADEALFAPPAPEIAPDAAPEPELGLESAPPPSPPRAPVRRARETNPNRPPAFARYAYWIAAPAALAWAGCMAAFASGYQNPFGPFEYRPFPIVAFGALCLLPAIFILLAAYAVRQAASLALETRRARELAGELAVPAALAADQAGGAAEAVRREVDRAAAAALAAEQQLLDLRKALADESERLIEATSEAERRAQALSEGLSRERTEMSALAESLGAHADRVSHTIDAGARMVAEASDLAAVQLQEAEALLAARATDLAAAAGEAGEAAQIVGDALGGHIERLEEVGEAISGRVEGLQTAFSEEHLRLAALADRLRADQEHIAARIDAQREALLAASADARSGVDDLTGAAEEGAQSLRGLIAVVAEEVGRLAAAAEADQAVLNAAAQENLKLFTGAVAEERAALEAETRAAIEALADAAAETRQAALDQGEAVKARVEALGEAAFAVGKAADQAFDTRIDQARRAIEQTAELVEAAGLRSAEKIEQGVAATRGALEGLQALLGDIDAKIAALPDEARARAETVREAVDQSLSELTAAARRASEETQAIDAAFQARIKHNYEMLSEALRLMGKVAGAAPRALAAAASAPTVAVKPVVPETERSIRMPQQAAPTPTPSADALGLRPRLKLTPAGAESAARAAPISPTATLATTPPPAAPPRPAAIPPAAARAPQEPTRSGEWTWKDLLSSIDEPPMDDDVLAERLISEIEALGLDASGLLPLSRIDEIAAVLQSGDIEGAREVVRNLAPSAVRRLSRRVLTDKVLHAHADRYLQRYEDLLADSAKRDRDGFVTAALLGSDPGRAFLLFNAAVGELH